MIELDASTQHRKPELSNFFIECDGCGYDLRFDYLDQTRSCPQCGSRTSLSPEYQAFLCQEKEESVAWLKRVRESLT